MPMPRSTTSEWRTAAGSITGRSHVDKGQGCQDTAHWRRVGRDGEVLVAAIADGASSATLGRVGAEVAATTAVDAICQPGSLFPRWPTDADQWRDSMAEVLHAARTAVLEQAAQRSLDRFELGTTLIVVVSTPDFTAAAQIGDGAVVLRDPAGNLAAMTAPALGEYINATTFLVADDALESAQLVAWPGRVSHLAAFSDGLQMLALALPEGTPHSGFFAPLFTFIEAAKDDRDAKRQVIEFLSSPRICGRTDDDLTLLLAART